MYIRGVGRTKFGKSRRSLAELAYEAMYNAMEDSQLDMKDIDAIVSANFVAGPTEGQEHISSFITSLLPGINLPVYRVEGACASGGTAVNMATMLLDKYENILVVGAEKLTGVSSKKATTNLAMAGDAVLDYGEGVIFPAQYAIVADMYMRRYGAVHDDLALVSLKNHKNANLQPLAHFHYKDVDMDTIRKSPMVASPLNLFDWCPISDGAAAAVLSCESSSGRDIKILASEVRTDAISLTQRPSQTSFSAAVTAAEAAYKAAGIGPQDIDIAEVHDCFTIAELVAMEDLGFCARGKAPELVRNGDTAITGRIPINTDGGLIGDGHPVGASGIGQIYEVVEQLRGTAGKRQVKDAHIGLTHNIGGSGGSCAVHILEGL